VRRVDEEAVWWRSKAQRVSADSCLFLCRTDRCLLVLRRVPLKPPTPQEVSLSAKACERSERGEEEKKHASGKRVLAAP
jgi:hypothetical protein